MLISVPAGKELHFQMIQMKRRMKELFTEAWSEMRGKRGKVILFQGPKQQRKEGTGSQTIPVPAGPWRRGLWSCEDRATARDASLKQRGSGEEIPWASSGPVLCYPAGPLIGRTQKEAREHGRW